MNSAKEYIPCPTCNDEWIDPSSQSCSPCMRLQNKIVLIEENNRLRAALEDAAFTLKILEGPILDLAEVHRRMAVNAMAEIKVALKK